MDGDLDFIRNATRVDVSDTEAKRWLEELKARPGRSSADQAIIDYLEEGLRIAATRDMRKVQAAPKRSRSE